MSAVVLGHLSDLHLDGGAAARDRVEAVVAHLATMAAGFTAVLVTGDVSDRGAAEDYETAGALLSSLPVPVLLVPGNHDDRAAFASGLLGRDGHVPGAPVDQVVVAGAVRFVLLDSTVPGEPWGRLAPESLALLAEAASTADGLPTVVAFHHPPVALGIPEIDAIRLRDADELASVVRAHQRIVAVLCGHAHTAAAATFAGRPLRVAPGVRSTAALPGEPSVGAMVPGAPPAAAVHVLRDGDLVTHVRAFSGFPS